MIDDFDLRVLNSEFERAKVVCLANKRHYERLSELWTDGAASQGSIEDAEAAWKEAQQDVEIARARLERAKAGGSP